MATFQPIRNRFLQRFALRARGASASDRVVGTGITILLAGLLVFGAFVSTAWSYGTGLKVDLKVLLISADGAESSFEAWMAALDREGVPYDVVIANTAPPIAASTLTKAADHGRYQAVVLATGGLVHCSLQGCATALAPAEWTALDTYQAKFKVRRVSAYTWPTPAYGLNYPFESGDLAGSEGELTAAGKSTFRHMVGAVPFDFGTWGYYATPLPPAADGSSKFTTLVAGPADFSGNAASLAGVYSRPDGFEELVITYATNPWQMQSLLLGRGLVAWATQGVRLGYQRNYFTVHIDDVFLPDDRWDVNDNVTYEDDGVTNPLIRMVASDISRALDWQRKTGLQMDFVFNGGGSAEAIAENGSDPLTTAALAAKDSFTWINHTWSHPNLDNATADQIYTEIRKNLKWARANGIQTHRRELVTGEHSGLANPAMAAALDKARIRWIAADNSKQPDPYMIGKATTIPRHPSNLYYNVGTFAEQLDEYNYIYFENCTNTATTTCFSAPATWDDYVNNEASIMFRHVLTNDPRPHYAHQNNLAEEGTMYPVVDELLDRYHRYVNTPIHQPTFRGVHTIMARLAKWQAAESAGSVDGYYLNGYIYLRSTAAGLRAPVTGTRVGAMYGGERSGWVRLRRNRTRRMRVVKQR